MESISIFKVSIFLVIATSLFYQCISQGSYYKTYAGKDEPRFSHDPSSPNGPANWGKLRPEWYLCGNGTMQSPIDLKNGMFVAQFGELQTFYKPALATLFNRGHGISFHWDDFFFWLSLSWEGANNPGYIKLNGTKYDLEQCHLHTPGEHTLDGQTYDLEIHCVHKSDTDRTAVIATLYKAGETPDPFLTLLSNSLITLANGAKDASVGVVNPSQIQDAISEYYRYIGSQTVPPCSEDFVWTVFTQIKSVSGEQLKLLSKAVQGNGFNSRPVQPLNNRTLLLYKRVLNYHY